MVGRGGAGNFMDGVAEGEDGAEGGAGEYAVRMKMKAEEDVELGLEKPSKAYVR